MGACYPCYYSCSFWREVVVPIRAKKIGLVALRWFCITNGIQKVLTSACAASILTHNIGAINMVLHWQGYC